MDRSCVDRDAILGRVPVDTQVFQHIAKFYNYDIRFIVRAAVYWGFGRQLHSRGS